MTPEEEYKALCEQIVQACEDYNAGIRVDIPAPVVARYHCVPILPSIDDEPPLPRNLRNPPRKLLRKAPRGTWSDLS